MDEYNPNNYTELVPYVQQKKKSPYLTRKMGAALAALCILTAGTTGFAAGVSLNRFTDKPEASSNNGMPSQPVSAPAVLDNEPSDALSPVASSPEAGSTAQLAEQTANSVVEITTEVTQYDSFMRQYVSQGAGSGVVLSTDGYIVTNNHVIEGADKITVTFRDGSNCAAELVGTDPQGDIAVIKAEASGLQPAVLGDSSSLRVGDAVIAVGNPLGQLGGTVTDGIISALDREIDIDGQAMTLLQTNAAINPGNSGGGLFNSQGELIGIVVAKSSGSGIEGLGFAIPVNIAKGLIDDIIEYGYVKGHIDLGMTTIDVSNAQTAMMYRLSGIGVYIDQVVPGSNAEKVGFHSGDRILSFNGQEVSSGQDLTKAISGCQVGDTVEIVIYRNGSRYSGQLTLEEYRPAN